MAVAALDLPGRAGGGEPLAILADVAVHVWPEQHVDQHRNGRVDHQPDHTARAGDIAARTPQSPLLVLSGELDFPVLRTDAAELVGSLRQRYVQPEYVQLVTVAELAHPLAKPPGLQLAPQLPVAKVVDEAMTQWFLRHLAAR